MSSVGIDLGGTKCLAVLAGPDGAVLDEIRVSTPTGAAAVMTMVAEVAEALLEGRRGGVSCVGLGVPGTVDNDGVLRHAPNLPGVVDLPLAGPLSERLGVPVLVENDATCAGWGERQVGAARGRDHVVLVTLGTGIGGGMVLDGLLYRGRHGFAGEIGHMVVDPRGPICTCGRRGCWERFASGSGLRALAREAALAHRARRVLELAGDVEAVRGEHVTAAASEGDDEARAVLATFAWWVALGLVNLTTVLDPQAFVLGGGLVEAGETIVEPVRASFFEQLRAAGYQTAVEVLPAALGERAGAIGAALLAQAGPRR